MNQQPWPLAEYLAGELGPEEHAAVDDHLVECDDCWREVQLARLGQSAAARTAQVTPDDVRRRVIHAVRDGNSPPGHHSHLGWTAPSARPHRRVRVLLTAVAAVLAFAVVGFGAGLTTGQHTGRRAEVSRPAASTTSTGVQMGTVAAALSYYRQGMLPGTGIASTPAPDLRTLGLRVTGASNGMLAAQPVTAYVYSDARGTRQIYVFLSVTVFQALTPHGGAPTETRTVQGYTVFAATRHPMLIVGLDHALVTRVGTHLT